MTLVPLEVVCRELRYTEEAVLTLVACGALTRYQKGKAILFDAQEVEELRRRGPG